MFLIYGRRKARIKKYTDYQQPCQSCKVFDQDVRVYRDYYHFFFIPVFPIGEKTVSIRCKNCGEPMRLEVIKKHYEKISKTPFYLFTGTLLLIGLVFTLYYFNLSTQRDKIAFLENPKVGDVYTIRIHKNNKAVYYFLRLSRVVGDTVFAYHNNLEYGGYVSRLDDDDYFVENEEVVFLKSDLKQMLGQMKINAVERDYGEYEGFKRIR